jgi:hypothetical protein
MTCHAIYWQKARTKSKDIGGSYRLTAGFLCQRVKCSLAMRGWEAICCYIKLTNLQNDLYKLLLTDSCPELNFEIITLLQSLSLSLTDASNSLLITLKHYTLTQFAISESIYAWKFFKTDSAASNLMITWRLRQVGTPIYQTPRCHTPRDGYSST